MEGSAGSIDYVLGGVKADLGRRAQPRLCLYFARQRERTLALKYRGSITAPYLRLIDSFRRFIIYPVLLRSVHAAWMREFPGAAGR